MNAWFDGPQSMVPGPAALASSENLLEMQIFIPHPRLTESEFCKWGPKSWALISTPGDSEAHSNLRTTVSVWMPQHSMCVTHSVVSDSLRLHGLLARQAPLSMEFTRKEYCSGLPFPSPEDLPNPGINPESPALQADSLPSAPPGMLLPWPAACCSLHLNQCSATPPFTWVTALNIYTLLSRHRYHGWSYLWKVN